MYLLYKTAKGYFVMPYTALTCFLGVFFNVDNTCTFFPLRMFGFTRGSADMKSVHACTCNYKQLLSL